MAEENHLEAGVHEQPGRKQQSPESEPHVPNLAHDSEATTKRSSQFWCEVKRHGKQVVLCAVIVVVWMLMAVPTVLFYLPSAQESSDAPKAFGTCVETVVYDGVVCREALQCVQSWIPGTHGYEEIHIPAGSNQDELESQAYQILANLTPFEESLECEKIICLHLFSLCDRNGTLHRPSFQQCQTIRNGSCVMNWEHEEANMTLSFTDCKDASRVHTTYYDGRENESSNGNGSGDVPPDDKGLGDSPPWNITCSKDFFFNGNSCRPECMEWEEAPKETKPFDAISVSITVIDIIISAAVIVISCVRYKRKLNFPKTIMIFYINLDALAVSGIIIVGYTDRKALFCTSRDLQETVYNPSPFCTISGIIYNYCNMQMMFWWVCHCMLMFWAFVCPFHYKRFPAHRLKYIHLLMLGSGLTIPAISVGTTFTVGEYTFTSFPPVVCLPSNQESGYYSLVIPLSILLATGTSLLTVIFYKIITKFSFHGKDKVTAQAKILLVLCYYCVAGVVVLIAYVLLAQNEPKFLTETWKYFVCESKGTGEPCETNGFTKVREKIAPLISLSFFLIALVPIVNLLFVVPIQTLFTTCRNCFMRTYRMVAHSASTSTS